ncbi:NmrA-like family protein [Colletotrichum tofieldiae]|uniref:NmrA-like family protein (Rossmann-fold NAD(P)(+)-binding protein) n=1 Tax=Colletotrichum tofieldiae TaxID=708197 RepID=A0A166P2C7_9PEZI|nr:NmrA-like family protein (Rossmann-fold NAD(P)(+)-binding protein) [Colletotrichum tofieldiae]GKT52982.1 NmrA-like family protein [Colletotrichum tofieldiae]GKT80624.1 NmrA-like family protein [Colletotrichum tofieldiae]GKT88750.1 nmrA-like family protein [Colletotrichum tofieldiae]
MTFNRIAVYGHRGWASSSIVEALISSGAPVKVLYRAGSDTSDLPAHITKTEVNVDDEAAVIDALQDIDIVISLVGHEGVQRQHGFVRAIPKTNVKLFSPSDLAGRYDEQGLKIGVNKAKDELEKASKAAGIPTTVVLVGNFAEFALNTPGMGVDLAGNKITYSGNSADEKLNLCTRKYVAEAYATIFATTPIGQLENRAIALRELAPTGRDIAAALQAKYGVAPQTSSHSLEKVNGEVEQGLESGSPFTLAWYCRKIWATGQQAQMVGSDFWEVNGYEKSTLEDLVVGGKLEAYREMPPQVAEYFRQRD